MFHSFRNVVCYALVLALLLPTRFNQTFTEVSQAATLPIPQNITSSLHPPSTALTLPVELIGAYDTPAQAMEVEITGSYAYVADANGGLRIINVSNPTIPNEVGFYIPVGNTVDVVVVGMYAYVVTNDNMHILDVSNVASPTIVGGYSTSSIINAVRVVGNYAYLAVNNALRIVDVSDRATPIEVGYYYVSPGYAYDIAVVGGYAYIAGWQTGLRIIDISNPNAPTQVGSYPTPGGAQSVVVRGDYAYVTSDSAGIVIVDVSNPAAPSLVGAIDTPGFASGIAISGNFAYVADWDKGLRVVDISNPAAPAEVGAYDTEDYAYDVAVKNGYVYLADADDGLLIFRVGSLTPIIFIPGFMGSRLFNNPTGPGGPEEEVWADLLKILDQTTNPHPMMALGLAPDGVTPAQNAPAYTTVHVVTGSRGILTRLGPASFYAPLLQHYANLGYQENVDLFVYPYDWRKDLRLSTNNLDQLIDEVRTQTGEAQVVIIAHSLGGLLTRQYLTNSAQAAKVQQAVLIASPLVGVPKSLYGVIEGDCLQLIGITCAPKREVVKAIAPNFGTFYQAMPSEAYFMLKGGGFLTTQYFEDATGTCPGCLSYQDTYSTTRTSVFNMGLSADAKTFHQGIDNLTSWNGVPVALIGGQNAPTPVGIYEYHFWTWGNHHFGQQFDDLVFSPTGDGLVPLLSSSLANSTTGINLRGTATFCGVNFIGNMSDPHVGITQAPLVWAYIDGVLGLAPNLGCPGVAVALSSASKATQMLTTTVATSTQIIAYGVAAIDSYDVLSNHTGISTTGLIEQGIPGSTYYADQALRSASLVLMGGQPYTITLIPTGGSIDIKLVRSNFTGTLTTTLYSGISVTTQSRMTLIGDPYRVNNWQLYPTGSGGSPQIISPSVVLTASTPVDTIPPTITIALSGTVGPQGWYISPVTVTLTASDNVTGTGLSRIEYAFYDDVISRVYTGPFVVDPAMVNKLYTVAIDNSFNFSTAEANIGPMHRYLPFVRR